MARTRIFTAKVSRHIDDKNIDTNKTYYYWLKAVDTTKNKSDFSAGAFAKVTSQAPSVLWLPVCGGSGILPGSFVNIYQNPFGGSPCVRSAKSDEAGYEAHGFVLDLPVDGYVTVYGPGCVNTKPYGALGIPQNGYYYLEDNGYIPGGVTATIPTTSGHFVQKIGIPITAPGSGLQILFLYHEPVILYTP